MFKLVAIDVDGTLLNSKQELTERNRRIIHKLVDRAVHVVLVTGKAYVTAKDLMKSLRLVSPQITNDGSLVIVPGTEEILYRQGVPEELAEEVISVAEKMGVTIAVLHETRMCVTGLNEDTDYMATYNDPTPTVVSDLAECLDTPPTHLMVVAYGKDDLYELATSTFKRRFGSRLNVVRSSPYYLEFLHPEVSKGRSLAFVSEYLKIPRNETVGFGDGDNDISFLSYVGCAVAMGNSTEEVQRIADMVTDTCDRDGVAKALEALFSY